MFVNKLNEEKGESLMLSGQYIKAYMEYWPTSASPRPHSPELFSSLSRRAWAHETNVLTLGRATL